MSFIKPLLSAIALSIGTATLAAPIASAQANTVGVINYDQIKVDSRAGQNIVAQLTAIGEGLKGEVSPAEAALQTATETFAAKFEGLSQEERTAKMQADAALQQEAMGIAQTEQAVATNTQLANLVMQATSEKAWTDFDEVLRPVIRQVAGENGVEVVFESGSLVYFEPAADFSAKVVAKLDATTPTIAVTRQNVELVVDRSGQIVGAQAQSPEAQQ